MLGYFWPSPSWGPSTPTTPDVSSRMSRTSWGVAISSCGAATLKFDLLGSLDFGGGYEDLLPYSEVLDVGGSAVRVLTLEKQVELKRQLTRSKDKLMLVHLEAALDEVAQNARASGAVGQWFESTGAR